MVWYCTVCSAYCISKKHLCDAVWLPRNCCYGISLSIINRHRHWACWKSTGRTHTKHTHVVVTFAPIVLFNAKRLFFLKWFESAKCMESDRFIIFLYSWNVFANMVTKWEIKQPFYSTDSYSNLLYCLWLRRARPERSLNRILANGTGSKALSHFHADVCPKHSLLLGNKACLPGTQIPALLVPESVFKVQHRTRYSPLRCLLVDGGAEVSTTTTTEAYILYNSLRGEQVLAFSGVRGYWKYKPAVNFLRQDLFIGFCTYRSVRGVLDVAHLVNGSCSLSIGSCSLSIEAINASIE